MRLHRPLDDALATSSHVRVLRALLHLPEGLDASGREIARRAGVSHPTASKVLRDLHGQGLVRRERRGRSETFALSVQNMLVGPIGKLFEAEEMLPYRLLGELRGVLERVRDVRAAYLFGSAVRGEMTRDSDVDLAVVVADGTERVVEERLEPTLRHLRERIGAPVQLVLASGDPPSLTGGRGRLWRRILREGLEIKRSPSKKRRVRA